MSAGRQRTPVRLVRRWWPPYWWASAALLLAMAVARASAITDLLGDLGREQARSDGWYDSRRVVQLVAVLVVATAWVLAVSIAIVRVPPRRRRYLPHAICLSALFAFAAIRAISLHHIDSVLYDHEIAGARVVAIAELLLLVVTGVVGCVTARFDIQVEAVPVVAALDER